VASGIWQVGIRARPSLSQAIDTVRIWTLGISFGVMLVLVAATAVLFVSARRSSELAALHQQFATGVSHELRTPLSVISSASENLADGVIENTEQMRHYGRMIHSHVEQFTEMIENALWFARKDGTGELELAEVDIEELIDAATSTCRRMLEDAGVVLECDIEPGLAAIRGNRTMLLHGLQNLLTNVARHAQSGKWARVRVAQVGTSVLFTVEDRGQGIAPSEQARVFEPFYRGRQARQANAGGLGLGLSLVRRIVEAHRGRVELLSDGKLGTTVVFTVPVFKVREPTGPATGH
jgi:signal transduction histidine kinase